MARQDRVEVNPEVLAGKPVVKGTRLAVEFVVELVRLGWSESEILENYPGVTPEDIRACVAWAGRAADETG